LVVPVSAGVGGDFRREQDFSPTPLRGLPGASGGLRQPPAGSARDVTLPQLRTGVTNSSLLARRVVRVRARSLKRRTPLHRFDRLDGTAD